MKKTKFTIIVFSLVSFALAFSQQRWVHKEVFKYDGSGYYLYLPALFIYNDIGKLSFYKQIDSAYRPSDNIKEYGLYRQEKTGFFTNKYPIGTAIGELPAFLIMHAYTKFYKSNYPADGYSMPYQFAVSMSNILWTIIGLIFLSCFLHHFFSDSIVAISIAIIGFGTNLFCYTSIETGLSHTLAFMLFSLVLYFNQKWHQKPENKYAILLGLLLGWILITRPIDFIIVLVPLFWPLTNTNKYIKNKFIFLLRQKRQIIAACTAGFLVTSFQIIYWNYTSGHLIHFSYQGEGFNFLKPEIMNGLFSFRKGWFVYTPVALLSLLGFIPFYNQQKKLTLVIVLFFILFIYLVFSWHIWWYGWGFGSRPMVESYALISLPLASLISWLSEQKRVLKLAGAFIFTLLIGLNLFQTRQYRHGKIDGEFGTKESYIKLWKQTLHFHTIDNK